jgi:hypothetical protein
MCSACFAEYNKKKFGDAPRGGAAPAAAAVASPPPVECPIAVNAPSAAVTPAPSVITIKVLEPDTTAQKKAAK